MLHTDPGLATRLFTLFNCAPIDGIEGKRFLEADWSVECGVNEHAAMAVVGAAFMLLYILGIPLLMFALLFKNRQALHDENHPQHENVYFEYGGLYSSYEQKYYWFEVLIMTHKCFMTGALVLIGENSTVQPLTGSLFQFGFLLCVLKCSPYDSDDDDLAAFVSSMAIYLTTVGGMVLITRDSAMGGKSFDDVFLSVFFITIMAATLIFNVLMTVMSTGPGSKLRRALAEKLCRAGVGKERMKKKAGGLASTTSVVPVTVESSSIRDWEVRGDLNI
jgi:hypothetical protein